jgi:hypothetical protein
MTIFELQVITGASNSRPLRKFLKNNPHIFDFKTRELNITPEELKKLYQKHKEENKGGKKKITQTA